MIRKLFVKGFVPLLLWTSFFWLPPAYSKTVPLILVGSMENRFLDQITEIYQAELRQQRTPILGMGDGKLRPPGVTGPVNPMVTFEDLEKLVKQAAKTLKKGDTLEIFVDDHGSPPRDPNDPLSAGIVMSGGNYIPFKSFMEMIQYYVPKSNRVQLIGSLCHGGGLHKISQTLPNVCSSTSSVYKDVSYGIISGGPNLLWAPFYSGNSRTFYEAHETAALTDKLNPRDSLSSEDFLANLYQTYPYNVDPNEDEKERRDTAIDLNLAPLIEEAQKNAQAGVPKALCRERPLGVESKKYGKLNKFINKIFQPKYTRNTLSQTERGILDKHEQTLQQEIRKLSPLCIKHGTWSLYLQDARRQAIHEFDVSPPEAQNTSRPTLTRRLRQLDHDFLEVAKPCLRLRSLLQVQKNRERLMSEGTPQQQKKFAQIVKCELE